MNGKVIITWSLFAFSALSFAGTMGETTVCQTSTPFLGLEASYTWNQVNSLLSITNLVEKQQWGGRLSAGVVRSYTNALSLTGEFGGGYYGTVSDNNPNLGSSSVLAITGYDFLVGGLYKLNEFDTLSKLGLFVDIGAMVQTANIKGTVDHSKDIPGGLYSGIITTKASLTAMLPEIKAGGVYNLSDNFDLTLAYMYVFGNAYRTSNNITATSDSIVVSGTASPINPALSSILFGFRYKFV